MSVVSVARAIAAALPVALCAAPPGVAQTSGVRRPQLVVVRMVEQGPYGIAYDPIRVTVQHGDTIRFVQAGRLVHNVELRSVPAGADPALVGRSPDLIGQGSSYDVVIDGRFVPGKYFYVCTPHEVLGMAGIIYVVDQKS